MLAKRMKKQETSLLSYWTIRYFAILCVGLVIIAGSAVYWVMNTATNSRLQTAGLLAQEMAEKVIVDEGKLHIPPNFDQVLGNRFQYFKFKKEELCLIITDEQGALLYSFPPIAPEDVRKKLADNLTEARDNRFTAVHAPIMEDSRQLGQVVLLQSKRALAYSPNQLLLIAVLLLTLVLCGWFTLYSLSRKLARPIRKVADSARHIADGRYDVDLNFETPEREINELIGSFKDMAMRLQQLEEWRAVALADVTHELKTPVTSIKGLLLAVREGVVSQEEAGEFLDIALKESGRMERMVADLLNYNAFSSGSLEVRSDALDLGVLVSEIVYQWKLADEEDKLAVSFETTDDTLLTTGDALRIQQIIVNLLNNALQAAVPGRKLQLAVKVLADERHVVVKVTDNGCGIGLLEQPHIFERFFRGAGKKKRIRGLGLGLPYSRLLARAQGGELRLEHSETDDPAASGSTFVLELPLNQSPGSNAAKRAVTEPAQQAASSLNRPQGRLTPTARRDR
jgi:signal transduction histidine kinase